MLRVSRVVRTVLLGMAGVMASAAPGLASGLDLRAGGFLPRAESNLFDDDSVLYTVDKDDWRGFTGGAEFSFGLGDTLELGLHLDGYGRTLHTNYRDFDRPSGREITQTLKLTSVPMGFTVRFVPLGQHRLTPYVGAGADVVFYEYEEFGEFIDFEDEENLPIFDDAFISSGAAAGFHVVGGLRVPVSHDFSITGEVRYLWAKTDMGDDFRGNEIDLSGASATVGVHLTF
jgi:opacity protein-like surface antigen